MIKKGSAGLLVIVLVAVVIVGLGAWYYLKITDKNPSMSNSSNNPRIQDVSDLLASVGSYGDYAFGNDSSTFDPSNQFYKTLVPDQQVQSLTVLGTFTDHVKIQLPFNGYYINMPLGWYGAPQNNGHALLLSPDKNISIAFKLTSAADLIATDNELLANLDANFNNPGDTKGMMEIQHLPNGLAYIAKGYASASSQVNGTLFVVELDQPSFATTYDAEHTQGNVIQASPQEVVEFSLLAPLDVFDKYQGLMALIYQDLKAQIK